ncbi:glycoside hydrolase family 3 C-terminal domain-containing protein [Asticcacaulis sp. EMRT-3]|uniref:glycoside hydrolase family 3 C-terminal domain-containing protein n=1 Tax=Asticcacaulis sp. EMRT-3 TaxID=3040349 RepID=UPI0024AFC1A9|nr:glycoside hydrolase family 3 C-terminal domain-containing protein [Asticcacaulis sp. EMRT-3]MDI7775852.1 glycoside hydrolase family 3 C-terminal domain-containing protein [Asticcacaulis sp. EMRT-3]
MAKPLTHLTSLCSLMAMALIGMALPAAAQTAYPFRNPDLPAAQRIDNILSLMTVDEKIDALSTNSAVPRLGIPSFGSSEGIHGVVQRGNAQRGLAPVTTTQFPQPPGMGETWDPDLVRQAGGVEGYEGRYITQTTASYHHPILMLWGPQADLARDPRWGRGEEVYGEDPFLNGTMVAAFAHGLQGDDPHYWQAASLMKHFLANSNENGRGSSSSNFDARLFHEYYAVPFRMGFEDGGARGVMASYNAWNGTPMAVNPVLQSLVIDQWGADVISSDGGAVTNLVKLYKRYPTQEAAVVACLKAGINQFLDTYKDEVHAALKDGSLTEADLDTALRRKFRVTLKLGLLDPPDRVPYASIGSGSEPWTTAKDQDISKQMALESVTLLKNADAFLPLDRTKLKSVAVIGPLADSVHWDWYGGLPPHAVTPLEGIKALLGPGVIVHYAAGGDAAIAAAKASDVAIVVVGNDPTCGPDMAHDWIADGTKPCADPGDGREGRDRVTLALAQESLVKQVMAANPKTVMVLVSSFPYTITWSQGHVPAILHMTHASQDEGTALASVIFGDYNPGGHLTETWPASEAQLPPMMDYNIRHGRTYMYFSKGNWGQPLYPFGYGLSYTTFHYSHLRSDQVQLARDGALNVSVDVSNTGARAGDTVVQLYVQHPHSKVSRPERELEGFKRVHLAAGANQTVTIPLKAAQLAYWDEAQNRFVVETETVRLVVGQSSTDPGETMDIAVQ